MCLSRPSIVSLKSGGSHSTSAMSFRLPVGLGQLARQIHGRPHLPSTTLALRPFLSPSPSPLTIASPSAIRSIHTGPTGPTSHPAALAKAAHKLSSHFSHFLFPPPRIPQLPRRSFPGVGLRSFWTSRPWSIRQTYFPKGSGSGYGYGGDPRGGGGGWWSNFRRRIDRMPEMYVVSAASRCVLASEQASRRP